MSDPRMEWHQRERRAGLAVVAYMLFAMCLTLMFAAYAILANWPEK